MNNMEVGYNLSIKSRSLRGLRCYSTHTPKFRSYDEIQDMCFMRESILKTSKNTAKENSNKKGFYNRFIKPFVEILKESIY